MSSTKARTREVVEVRLHGRGGQGGVTCAKILAAVWARQGRSVQSFGDYAGERSGAPIRAYVRVSEHPIVVRNKVYRPDHLLVLDPTLLGADVVAGLVPGGTLLVNATEPAEAVAARFPAFRVAVVDATAIARAHGIGTRSVVIVNTTIAGAFARAMGIDLATLEATYASLGFATNLGAAREAFERVAIVAPRETLASAAPDVLAKPAAVLSLVDHREGAPPPVRTGSWRTQTPRYVKRLAPCNAVCPAGVDVVAFLHAAARGDEAGAAAILGRTSPFAAVCGRICPAPCEDACNRGGHDGAVGVRAVERFVADRVPVAATKPVANAKPRRVAIVGGGPAGLSAAYALRRMGHEATVFEGERALGGWLRSEVPAFRLPSDVLDREIDGILRLGVETRLGRFLSADDVADLATAYDAVVVATGLARRPTGANTGVEPADAFLRAANAGDRRVAGRVVVLGGDDMALDCARVALRLGATTSVLVHAGERGTMTAHPGEIEQGVREGVSLRSLCVAESFVGERPVTGVVVEEMERREDGSIVRAGRRATLAADLVLVALGRSAQVAALPADWTMREGRFRRGDVELPAFAAGDLVAGERSVAAAVGDGRRAALRALAAAGVAVSAPAKPDPAVAVKPQEIRFGHFERRAPATQAVLPFDGRLAGFDEVRAGLDDAEEAKRCLSCGKCTQCDTCLVDCPEGVIRRRGAGYVVDYADCKGCGICVAECPRKAMEMSAS
jgi:2-oxoacid:acceptor oxidoreductase gamma subunit (pyruvate/2-ketoisovalerate family)